MTSGPSGLSSPEFELDLPSLFVAVDVQAADKQRSFLKARAGEFSLLVLAAFTGMAPLEWMGGAGPLVAVGSLTAALILRVSGYGDSAEKRWYDARSAAESVKSAAWQYAVCGESYRRADVAADARFRAFLRQVLQTLPDLNYPADPDGSMVTPGMREVRQASLRERRDTYRHGRVDDQLRWYTSNAAKNKKLARRWAGALVGLYVLGLALGILRVAGAFDVDWLGAFAAAGAGVAAWRQTKNYTSLSEAYAVTSHEVEMLREDLQAVVDEPAWEQFVHDAEAAFSREHTLWLARRQGPPRAEA